MIEDNGYGKLFTTECPICGDERGEDFTLFSEHVREKHDAADVGLEDDRLRADGGCSETVVACPECDRASVQNNTTPGTARGRVDIDHQCQACKATFDEPVERERRREGYIRSDSPARQLDDMDPGSLDEVLES